MKQDMVDSTKWIMYVVVICLALTAGSWIWRYNTANIAGKVDAEVQIESGASRINGYEHFFNLCAAIQGYEAALASQEAIAKDATGDEAVHTRANIAGITAQRGRAIAQYNVDAAKAYTTARFFDDKLPRILSIKGTTQCAL